VKKLTDEEREYRALLENVRQLMKSKAGQDVVWFILSMCNLYGDQFSGNSRTFYEEGKRSVGLEILQLLEEADATIYPRLLLDMMKRKEARNG